MRLIGGNRTTAAPGLLLGACLLLLPALLPGAAGIPGPADRVSAAEPAGKDTGIKPVNLPDPKIPGFQFPEKEETINDWVAKNNQQAINKHAWGLWTALTLPSGETFEGQELLVFETWVTPQDLLTARFLKTNKLSAVPRVPRAPHRLRQLIRKGVTAGGEQTVLGFVHYDPTAAQHILDKQLFVKSHLDQLLNSGAKEVPAFPTTAISLKVPVKTASASQLVGGRYFMLPAWPGPPAPPKAFPPNAWGQCVWVDVQDNGPGPGTGKVDTVCKQDGSSRKSENTYGLGRFIHFRLSASQARLVNAIHGAVEGNRAAVAVAGNVVLVLGMHVTSREITRWTWQTFWWTPDPDNPPLPSSKSIAADRPAQLKGAARNYSHASSYSMVFPPQPNTGGSNKGESVYAYNPWLEAGFGPGALPASKPGQFQGKMVPNNVGVQTNCMSCHAQAAYSRKGDLSTTLYTGDQYIDLAGPQFTGNLRADFLWSIPDNAQ